MPRYIDALEIRYTYRPVGGDIAYKDEIETLPTADVAPVVHAHWIYKGIWYDGVFYECSACKRGICTDDGITTTKDYPYCHCGALMDEEVKDDA